MSSPTSPSSPASALALAAEARARAAQSPTSSAADAHSSGPFAASAQDKMPFYRLIDSQLFDKASKPQAAKTLQTLSTLVGNVLDPPNPSQAAKYRQLKLANPTIKRDIVSQPGAYDLLVAAGFRQTVINFEAHLVFAPSPSPAILHKLKTANVVLLERLERARESEAREKRMHDYAEEVEKSRKSKAMLGFNEDRRLKAEKDARESIARHAKAAAASSAASTTASSHRAYVAEQAELPAAIFHGSTRAADTMRVGAGEPDEDEDGMDQDEDEEEQPPSYGMLHGRVLGTGEAVGAQRAGVGVSRQDLEEEL